jgi:hypothetical protein
MLAEQHEQCQDRLCQTLKSPGEALVLGCIGEKRTIIGGQFATGVNGSNTRVAIHHASALKEVDGVLALREKHP